MVSESTRSCLRTEVASYRAFLFLRRNVELPSEECRAPSEECWAPSGVKYVRQRFRTSKTHSCRETNVEQKGIRGRPWFDFWGGVWMISEKKKYSVDWFRGKKFLRGNTWRKKNSYTEKKNLSWGIMLGKKSYTVVRQEKNSTTRSLGKKFLHKPNHPYHASKVKWSAPK